MERDLDIITLPEVDSTNSYLLRRNDLWHRDFLVVRAVAQTGGRGRHGRSWHQQSGMDLAFSMLHRLPPGGAGRNLVTIRAGLASYRALCDILGKGLGIKWPNDLYYESKKIGGILCEFGSGPGGPVVVVGIGINVNGTAFPAELAETSSSLAIITGREHDIEPLMEAVAVHLIALLKGPALMGDEEYGELVRVSGVIGSRVRTLRGGKDCTGIVSGISRDGALTITDGDTEFQCRDEAVLV